MSYIYDFDIIIRRIAGIEKRRRCRRNKLAIEAAALQCMAADFTPTLFQSSLTVIIAALYAMASQPVVGSGDGPDVINDCAAR